MASPRSSDLEKIVKATAHIGAYAPNLATNPASC